MGLVWFSEKKQRLFLSTELTNFYIRDGIFTARYELNHLRITQNNLGFYHS